VNAERNNVSSYAEKRGWDISQPIMPPDRERVSRCMKCVNELFIWVKMLAVTAMRDRCSLYIRGQSLAMATAD
jgi:hypothetical protein